MGSKALELLDWHEVFSEYDEDLARYVVNHRCRGCGFVTHDPTTYSMHRNGVFSRCRRRRLKQKIRNLDLIRGGGSGADEG